MPVPNGHSERFFSGPDTHGDLSSPSISGEPVKPEECYLPGSGIETGSSV